MLQRFSCMSFLFKPSWVKVKQVGYFLLLLIERQAMDKKKPRL